MSKNLIKLVPQSVLGVSAATLVVAFSPLAASAAVTQVDISSYTNYSLNAGQPTGVNAGNTSAPVASQQFDLLSSSGDNAWLGGTTGQSVDIAVDITNAAQVTTLMNTLYGQPDTVAATVTFKGSGGAIETFDLFGNEDIRDYNNYIWTNNINGVGTQEWWTNNPNPVPGDQSHRLDAQIFNLNSSFQGQTLTDIVVTAGQAGGNFSQPMLFAVDVTSSAGAGGVPEPAGWILMLVGFGGLGAMLRNQRRAAELA